MNTQIFANIISSLLLLVTGGMLCATYYFNKKQNENNQKTFTLNYIEMENNNKRLQEAKEWLNLSMFEEDKISTYADPVKYLTQKRNIMESGKIFNKNHLYIMEIIKATKNAKILISKNIINQDIYLTARHEDILIEHSIIYPYLEEKINIHNGQIDNIKPAIKEYLELVEICKQLTK